MKYFTCRYSWCGNRMKKLFLIFTSLILAFTLGRFYSSITARQEPIFVSVSSKQFEKEIEDKKAVILDIRTPEEFEKGRIGGAINIDFYEPHFWDKLSELDKDRAYKIYCNSGRKSKDAIQIMRELGFTNVKELSGGIEDWVSRNFPTCINC